LNALGCQEKEEWVRKVDGSLPGAGTRGKVRKGGDGESKKKNSKNLSCDLGVLRAEKDSCKKNNSIAEKKKIEERKRNSRKRDSEE